MVHPLDIEAVRLTMETGLFHYADFNDLTHRMEIFKTEHAGTRAGMRAQLVEFRKQHSLPRLSLRASLLQRVRDNPDAYKPEVRSWLQSYLWIWDAVVGDRKHAARWKGKRERKR